MLTGTWLGLVEENPAEQQAGDQVNAIRHEPSTKERVAACKQRVAVGQLRRLLSGAVDATARNQRMGHACRVSSRNYLWAK